MRYGALTLLFLTMVTVGISWADARLHPQTLRDFFTPKLILLNGVSILIALLPFFTGVNLLFAARLQIGRDLVRRRVWRQAVAALEPFAASSQRFLDTTGEAHALLAAAYDATGEHDRAATIRAYLHRRHPKWVEKLETPGQEKRPRPAKGKSRRRF